MKMEELNIRVFLNVENLKIPFKSEPYIEIYCVYHKVALIKMHFEYSEHKVKLLKPFEMHPLLTEDMKVICRKELSEWLPSFDSKHEEFSLKCIRLEKEYSVSSWDNWGTQQVEYRDPFVR